MGENTLSNNIEKLAESLLEWKSKYRNVYYFKVGNNEYILRLLSKSEYLALYFVQAHVSSEAEDLLLTKCVLFPELSRKDINEMYAGEAAVLIEKILKLSGFSTIETIGNDLAKEREKIQLLDNQIILIICKAFPHLTPFDIDRLDYPTILNHIALAEELLGTKLEITKEESSDSNGIDFDKENRKQGFVDKKPIKKMMRR